MQITVTKEGIQIYEGPNFDYALQLLPKPRSILKWINDSIDRFVFGPTERPRYNLSMVAEEEDGITYETRLIDVACGTPLIRFFGPRYYLVVGKSEVNELPPRDS